MTSLLKNMNYRSHTGLGAKHPIIEEFNLSEVAVSDDEWESLWEEWSMVGRGVYSSQKLSFYNNYLVALSFFYK